MSDIAEADTGYIARRLIADTVAASAEQVYMELAKNKLALTKNGVYKVRKSGPAPCGEPVDVESPTIASALKVIPLLITPSLRKTINSYAGKHVVEKLLHTNYISNGELIMAMMMLGYKWRLPPGEKDSVNVLFYALYTSLELNDWIANCPCDVPRF